MKKFLSMVLALTMALSLVTVSAGAKDFTDSDEVTYKEAVDVVSELGIVDGYTDGSFNPTGTLTRGAAAKIICNLILGPTTADALSADTAPYSDVPTTNVFAGYIAYCQQQGIISGYADGTFRPSATLTTYAFMKMLLGALGYDSSIEGFTGANWSVQVAKLAMGIGLDDGNEDFVGVQAVTREEACLYAFNTLTADMVEYGSTTTVEVNGATVVVGGSEAEKVRNDRNDYRLEEKNQDTYMQFCEEYFPDLELDDRDTEGDDFARPSNVWLNDDEEIGTYAKTADATFTAEVESGEIYDALNLSRDQKGDAAYTVYIDGVEVENNDDYETLNADGTMDIVDGEDDIKIGDNGVLVEVYKDEARICLTNTYVGQVDSVEEGNSRKDDYVVISDLSDVDPLGQESDDDEFETTAFEEDDIVLYTYSQKENKICSMEAADTVDGEVTRYTVDKSVTLDGEVYEYSYMNDTSVESTGVEYTLYLDSYGYVIYFDEGAVNVANFAYVIEAGTDSARGGNDHWAKLLYMDGTIETVSTKDCYGTAGTAHPSGDDIEENLEESFVTYKEASNGEFTLRTSGSYRSSTDTSEEGKILSNGASNISALNTAHNRANSDTIVLVYDVDDDDASVYTGINEMPDVTVVAGTTAATLKKNSSNYAAALVVYVSDGDTVSNTTSDYIFLRGANVRETVTSDDTYYEFDAVVDGEITTVMLDSSDAATRDVIATLVTPVDGNRPNVLLSSYSVDGDLYTVSMSDDTDVIEAVSEIGEVSGGVVSVDGDGYTLADDVAVFRVNASGDLTAVRESTVRDGTVGANEDDDRYAQFQIVLNSDEEVIGIFFELN